uniref:Sulfotransferase domain-containing protein n=1 Tax=viral metagenome TaxID=1070528 RepID=A0A6C0HFW3_9ZZZZ
MVDMCIYSIRRSGRHIVVKFLRTLNLKFCGCAMLERTRECYKTEIHLQHECGGNGFDFTGIKKCLFLYRKDKVEQLDAIVRLMYSVKIVHQTEKLTETDHMACTLPSDKDYFDYLSVLDFKNYLKSCENFHNDIEKNKNNENCLFVDFDSLVYDSRVQLKKIAKFISSNTIDDNTIDTAIDNYLVSFGKYVKKKISDDTYNRLKTLIDSYSTVTTNNNKRLQVVSHGGSATTTFMEFISKYIPTNCSRDLDGLKHTIPSKIEDLPSRIIYIYGDMDKTMRSLFRRKAGNTTIASIHEHKLKGIKHSKDLPANFEDFEAYTKLVVEENREPVGCLVHMREWKKVPNVFFIHYEQICTSDTIDDYLGIPKGTCSQFTVMPRVSELQPCETPEYLETMKGLDLRVQGIIKG